MTAALEDAHEDRLGLCPFRGTVAASAGLAVDHGDANVLFGGIVGGLDVRTVEEHKEVVPIASQMFRESLVGRIGESAVQQAVHLRLEESLGNAQAMRADLASIAPIAQGEGVPEDGLDQAWEAHRPARGRLQ